MIGYTYNNKDTMRIKEKNKKEITKATAEYHLREAGMHYDL